MGGNIKFKKETKRIESKEDFNSLFELQKDLLKNITADLYVPHQFTSKTSFGDLDVIVPMKYYNRVLSLILFSDYELEPNFQLTSNTISYQYNSHQIDLIFIPEHLVEYAVNYFSYGDHGSLLGRLLKKQSLKNSFLGFYFRFYKDNKQFKREVLISQDYKDVIETLQLDYKVFQSGFKTEIDMFKWVCSSPHFDKNCYSLENLNNKERARDSKRSFYNNFLDYIHFTENPKDTSIIMNFKHTKVFKENFLKVCKEYEDLQKYKNKFNGDLVSNLLDLHEKEVGIFLSKFKKVYMFQDILNMADDELETNILNFK